MRGAAGPAHQCCPAQPPPCLSCAPSGDGFLRSAQPPVRRSRIDVATISPGAAATKKIHPVQHSHLSTIFAPGAAARLAKSYPSRRSRRCGAATSLRRPFRPAQPHTLRKRFLTGHRRRTGADVAFVELFGSSAQPPFSAALPRGAAALSAEKGRRVTHLARRSRPSGAATSL